MNKGTETSSLRSRRCFFSVPWPISFSPTRTTVMPHRNMKTTTIRMGLHWIPPGVMTTSLIFSENLCTMRRVGIRLTDSNPSLRCLNSGRRVASHRWVQSSVIQLWKHSSLTKQQDLTLDRGLGIVADYSSFSDMERGRYVRVPRTTAVNR